MTFDHRSPPIPTDCRCVLPGRIRSVPEDFVVDEVPLYTPSGQGTHTLALIEKRAITTPGLLGLLARALRVSERSIGYAGLKDRNAVTRQWISVSGPAPADVLALEIPGLRVLEAGRHQNKLRLGHLRGNRFTITVRDVPEDALAIVTPVLETLARRGMPNGFGPQRFGNQGNNHLLGGFLIHGDADGFVEELLKPNSNDAPRIAEGKDALRAQRGDDALATLPNGMVLERHLAACLTRDIPRDEAMKRLPKRLRSLMVSAWQSAIFNEVLAARLDTFDQLIDGDIAMKHGNGASFQVTDLLVEQPRALAFEISPTGPMPGRKTMAPEGLARTIEDEVLTRYDALPFPDGGLLPAAVLKGERRALRVPVDSPTATRSEEGHLVLQFGLPRGCFATSLLECLSLRDDGVEPHEVSEDSD